MLAVGITGSLASGKTTVARIFSRLGAIVLDADKIAHRFLYKNTPGYKKVIRAFGRQILNSDGSINRRALGKTCFKHKKNLMRLSTIVHPLVKSFIERKLVEYKKKASERVVIVEAVLLIESGIYKHMDINIVVKVNLYQQISRALKKGKLKEREIKQRLKFQLPLKKQVKYADYVIDNRGHLKQTEAQVKAVWKKFTALI